MAAYAPAFASVMPRKRVKKVDHGISGFFIGNKTLEIGFYDKAEEMKLKEIALCLRPVNCLRPELRIKKSALLRSALSCSSLAELPEAWTRLRPVYNEFMRRDVFKAKNERNDGASLEIEQLAAFAAAASPRQPFQNFAKQFALLTLVQQCGLGAAKDFAATQFGYDPTTRSGERQIARLHEQLEQAEFTLANEKIARTGHKVKELRKELERRILVT